MFTALQVTWLVTAIIADFFGLYMLYTFFKLVQTFKKENTPKSIMISGCIVLIAGIMGIFVWSIERYQEAFSLNASIISTVAAICFALQIIGLLLFFFNRLNYIFKGKYKLSKCTVRFFMILFISFPILWIITLTIALITKTFPFILVALIFIIPVIIVLSLSYTLLKKLVLVYKIESKICENDRDNHIIRAITKTVILNTTWIMFTILDLIGIIIYRAIILQKDNMNDASVVFMAIFVASMTIADIVANYFSVFCSFKPFGHYYTTCCKCVDDGCQRCVTRCIHGKPDLETQIQQQIVSSSTLTVSNEKEMTISSNDKSVS